MSSKYFEYIHENVQSVDDRTPAERGLLSQEEALAVADPRLVGSGIKRLPKSRYDSISTYIYHCKVNAILG